MAKISNTGSLVQSLARELDPTCYSEDQRSCMPYVMKDSVHPNTLINKYFLKIKGTNRFKS